MPTVELIRQAHQQNIKVIIVSDTYFTEKQLRRLLKSCLPIDVYPMIHKLYCSSEYGHSKMNGLFRNVIQESHRTPESMLHIGDNPHADRTAPLMLGIDALHIKQLSPAVNELKRMHNLAQTLLDQSVRHTRPLTDPLKEIFAHFSDENMSVETRTGFYALGPILFAFSLFIHEEIKTLSAQGKHPKILFLMRDGYLPSLSYETLFPEDAVTRVRISRFASYAASFNSKYDIDLYLFSIYGTDRLLDICKQLLIPKTEAEELVKIALAAKNPREKFNELIHQKSRIQQICEASQQYRQRLYRYLQKTVDLQRDDTLVFVDLGYIGTSQIKLAPIFKKEWNIDILGRYFIAHQTPGWEQSRAGLLDPSWCDTRQLSMLVKYIALFEQLCTSTDQSVVDYDIEGNPIFATSELSDKQNETLLKIQSASLDFMRCAKYFIEQDHQAFYVSRHLRDMAASELARLIWFQTKSEIEMLSHFQFELNLGAEDIFDLFDTEEGFSGLHRRGLFFMEHNLSSMRMNYPTELRFAGLELSVTFFTMLRHQGYFNVADATYRAETVSCVIKHIDGSLTKSALSASHTYDGFYALLIPFSVNEREITVVLGEIYHWVQIHYAEVLPITSLYTNEEQKNTVNVLYAMGSHNMVKKGDTLYECSGEDAALHFTLRENIVFDHSDAHTKNVLRIIYRPIEKRGVETSENHASKQQ